MNRGEKKQGSNKNNNASTTKSGRWYIFVLSVVGEEDDDDDGGKQTTSYSILFVIVHDIDFLSKFPTVLPMYSCWCWFEVPSKSAS